MHICVVRRSFGSSLGIYQTNNMGMTLRKLRPFCSNQGVYFFLTEVTGIIRKQIDHLKDDYDEWHKGACKAVINAGSSERMIAFYDEPIQVTYGHAQKWVNMTMKYICLVEKTFGEGVCVLRIG